MDYSDDAIALELAARHAGKICFDAEEGEWLVWVPTAVAHAAMYRNGPTVLGDWRPDSTMKVFRLIRDVCRDIAGQADIKVRPKILSVAKMRAVEAMARCDQRLALDTSARYRQANNLRSQPIARAS